MQASSLFSPHGRSVFSRGDPAQRPRDAGHEGETESAQSHMAASPVKRQRLRTGALGLKALRPGLSPTPPRAGPWMCEAGVHSDLRLLISLRLFPRLIGPVSGCVSLPSHRTGPAQDKHALLDVTPSAVERLNYVQYYPIVVFCAPESRSALKALRQWLAPASRRSTRRLYAQAQKLWKHSEHLFTGRAGAGVPGRVTGPAWVSRHADAPAPQPPSTCTARATAGTRSSRPPSVGSRHGPSGRPRTRCGARVRGLCLAVGLGQRSGSRPGPCRKMGLGGSVCGLGLESRVRA